MKKTLLIAIGASLLGAATVASAQSPFYIYDYTNPSAGLQYSTLSAGGAVGTGIQLTKMNMDDVHFNPDFAGASFNRFEFSMFNAGTNVCNSRPRFRFWNMDSVNVDSVTAQSGPGTYFNNNAANWGVSFGTIPTNPAALNLYYSDFSAFAWTMPASGKFWVGQVFDNSDGAATPAANSPVADLNLMGFALGSQAVGSSENVMFQTTSPGSFFGTPNPAGSFLRFTNNTPLANMVYAFATNGQDITGTLQLNDTGFFAFNRSITLTAKAGTKTVVSQVVVATGSTSTFLITLPATMPAALSGPVTIEADGSSFLKKTTAVTLTGTTQDIGTVALQNGDVDNSGEVDAADIDQVIADFGATTDINSDVDVSGEVDAADIDIVIANFGGVDN